MTLPNLELDAALLSRMCEYAHDHGLCATDCLHEAISDWLAAVDIERVSVAEQTAPDRKRPASVRPQARTARVVSIS